jgi:hypothetical protein
LHKTLGHRIGDGDKYNGKFFGRVAGRDEIRRGVDDKDVTLAVD